MCYSAVAARGLNDGLTQTKETDVDETIMERISRLRKRLSAADIDALLVMVQENRCYLSGYTAEDTQFDESAGALLITHNNLLLATDSRYELQARREAPLFETVCYKESLDKLLPDLLKKRAIRKLGFESVRMSYRLYRKIMAAMAESRLAVELVPVEDLVEELRVVKSEPEIEAIRRALSIAESAFKDCLQHIRVGMTEKELAWFMEKQMRESGADGLSFPTIVAAGANSALPHAVPGNRKIKAGEPILFDWGARLNGYCSDISRTIVIGRPDAVFEKVFQTVLEAQRRAIDAIKAGVSSRSVDKVARDIVTREGYEGKFGHGLGHGTGLAIHEAPRLSPLRDTVLEAGMVSTIEPGIYLPGWGGVRLENMVVVRDDGADVLNRHDPAVDRL